MSELKARADRAAARSGGSRARTPIAALLLLGLASGAAGAQPLVIEKQGMFAVGGKVLGAMVKRIVPDAEVTSLVTIEDVEVAAKVIA